MKTAISVPDETFYRVEARAAALKMNRSEFYATAAERFLDELERESLTSEINAAIGRASGRADRDSFARAGLAQLGELTANDEW
jgi:hypothetical protein